MLGMLALVLSQQACAQSDTEKYSQKQLLKNWALSRCLAQAYTDKSTKDDANATASAYLEYGKQPIEVYTELDALVGKYSQRHYSGSVDSSFNTMKCIDLFNSKELDDLSGKLSKKNK